MPARLCLESESEEEGLAARQMVLGAGKRWLIEARRVFPMNGAQGWDLDLLAGCPRLCCEGKSGVWIAAPRDAQQVWPAAGCPLAPSAGPSEAGLQAEKFNLR